MSEYFEWMPKQLIIKPSGGRYFPYCVDELYRFEKRKTEDLIFLKQDDDEGDGVLKKVTHIMMFIEKSRE